MGSWSVYCGISQISISAGHKCVLLPIKEKTGYDCYYPYLPATLPIFGEYDDYGGLENIELNENTKFIEEYFGCTIKDFCSFFTNSDEVSEDNFNEKFSEMKDWQFMFIDRNVYDFMSSFVSHGYGGKGHLEYGNKKILELLGFTYIGTTEEIETPDEISDKKRYKYIWEFDGERFFSDGEWLQHKKGSIYNFTGEEYNNLSDYIKIPDDKIWIGEKAMWQLWKCLDDDKRYAKLSWILDIGYSTYTYTKQTRYFNELFKKELESNPDSERKDKLESLIRKDEEFCLPKNIAAKYLENIDTFGDMISELVTVSHNLHSMSGSFIPYIMYITPQCGEFEHHQIILEKFAEINKSYIDKIN